MSYQMRGLFIDHARNEMYLLQPPAPRSGKPPHVLRVYDMDINLKREVLTRIGDSACGPRVDLAGNIYVGDIVNQRLVRVKIDYAAAETVSLP